MSALTNRRKKIEILFAEGEATLRNQLRGYLVHEGYGSIKGLSHFETVHEELSHSLPDLVILDLGMVAAGKAAQAVRDLRHFNMGKNPFVPVIVTAWEASASAVREVADAGIDDFLAKPFAPKQILDRMRLLVKARKPFVVTSDYIGPDRRKDTSRGSTIDPIEVPNSLRGKEISATWDDDAFLLEIQQSKALVNEERIRRTAIQTSFLINLIRDDFASNRICGETIANLGRLRQATEELARRVTRTEPGTLGEMVLALGRLCATIAANPKAVAARELQLLPLLGMAIMRAAFPERDEAALGQEVAAAVRGYRARRQPLVATG